MLLQRRIIWFLLVALTGLPRGVSLPNSQVPIQRFKSWPLQIADLVPGSEFALRHKTSRFFGVSETSFSLEKNQGRKEIAVEHIFHRSFMLHNVLTANECESLIKVTEHLGYDDIKTGVLNNNAWVTWVFNNDVIQSLMDRCSEHVPQIVPPKDAGTLSPRQLSGLNPRCRFYRYMQNDFETFKPHRDDPNPRAGLVSPTSKLFHWDTDGEQFSLFTFLLYLNDDFEGGETNFFFDQDKVVGVRPVQGSVLVFPQTARFDNSDAERKRANTASPLHEGSRVRPRRHPKKSRPKYVMRSDILYGLLDDSSGWRFGERHFGS